MPRWRGEQKTRRRAPGTSRLRSTDGIGSMLDGVYPVSVIVLTNGIARADSDSGFAADTAPFRSAASQPIRQYSTTLPAVKSSIAHFPCALCKSRFRAPWPARSCKLLHKAAQTQTKTTLGVRLRVQVVKAISRFSAADVSPWGRPSPRALRCKTWLVLSSVQSEVCAAADLQPAVWAPTRLRHGKARTFPQG